MDLREFIDAWHESVHPALARALAELARHETLPPTASGVSGFVDVLRQLRFDQSDVAPVAVLLRRADPHLQELGACLAQGAVRDVDDAYGAIASAIVDLAREPLDPWVLRALLPLVRDPRLPVSVVRALVPQHRRLRRGTRIHRAMAIDPWRELEECYEQHLLQAAEPSERERLVLPLLEHKHGTRGFVATQEHLMRALGYDPHQLGGRLRGKSGDAVTQEDDPIEDA